MSEDKSTCWYSDDCSAEMNRFYDQYKKSNEEAPHFKVLKELIKDIPKGVSVMDLGCGTAIASEYFTDQKYFGSDLPHIVQGCATRNYPQYKYFYINMVESDLKWISDYDVVLVNGVIDIMEFPLFTLEKLLASCKQWLIIHRQEITENGATHLKRNPSYNSTTYHSIISRHDFNEILKKHGFEIINELTLGFGNWENGGHSFLLRKAKSYALNDMDRKMNEIFGGKKGGVYIECGANDGLAQSNTAFFDFYKNWNGILIEPVYEVFEKCAKNRPSAHTINCALVGPEDAGKEITLRHYKGNNGLLSLIDDHKEEKRTSEEPEYVKSQGMPLNNILDQFSFPKYDLLSLDIEGGEEAALRGIDFDKYYIEWILIERLESSEFNPFIMLDKWYILHSALSPHDYLFRRRN